MPTTEITPRQLYLRAYYALNKSKLADVKKAAYAKNRERLLADKKRSYEENKAPKLEAANKWYAENSAYAIATRSLYLSNNPEIRRNNLAKRRSAPGEITPGWIPRLLELQKWTCIVCQKDLRYGYHIDHIEPIARGGENTDFNVQALCPKCNHEKSDKDPVEFMQSRGFLI